MNETFSPYANQGQGEVIPETPQTPEKELAQEMPQPKYRKDLDVILEGNLVTIEDFAEPKDGKNYYKIKGVDEPVSEALLSPAVEIQGPVRRSSQTVEIQGPVLRSKKTVEIIEEKK